MKKKEKNIVTLGIILGLVVCLGIVLAIVYWLKPNDKAGGNSNNSNTGNENVQADNIDKVLNDYDYFCKMIDPSQENIITYYEYLDVEGNRVIKSQSVVQVDYNNEDEYKAAKENPEYKDGKFDDKAQNIQYPVGGAIDYTKSETGAESVLYYEDLTNSLKELGYTCKPVYREPVEEENPEENTEEVEENNETEEQ